MSAVEPDNFTDVFARITEGYHNLKENPDSIIPGTPLWYEIFRQYASQDIRTDLLSRDFIRYFLEQVDAGNPDALQIYLGLLNVLEEDASGFYQLFHKGTLVTEHFQEDDITSKMILNLSKDNSDFAVLAILKLGNKLQDNHARDLMKIILNNKKSPEFIKVLTLHQNKHSPVDLFDLAEKNGDFATHILRHGSLATIFHLHDPQGIKAIHIVDKYRTQFEDLVSKQKALAKKLGKKPSKQIISLELTLKSLQLWQAADKVDRADRADQTDRTDRTDRTDHTDHNTSLLSNDPKVARFLLQKFIPYILKQKTGEKKLINIMIANAMDLPFQKEMLSPQASGNNIIVDLGLRSAPNAIKILENSVLSNVLSTDERNRMIDQHAKLPNFLEKIQKINPIWLERYKDFKELLREPLRFTSTQSPGIEDSKRSPSGDKIKPPKL